MMTHITKLFLLISFIFICSCQHNTKENKEQEPLDDFFQQLLGIWKMNDQNTFEDWTFSENQYRALVYKVEDADTAIDETVKIVKTAEDVFFRVGVADQNKAEEVDFKLVKLSNSHAVFENKNHDFPQKITYSIEDKNNLFASISGPINGELRVIEFRYHRIK